MSQKLEKHSFTFIDLFAGIGGFHWAMQELGGKCVFASEKDKFARQTYQANFEQHNPELFTDSDLFNEDINDLNLSKIPNFDILCAGFPCQPFSNAGKGLGFDDPRGKLFFKIIEIVKYKIKQGDAPKVILLENVQHFVNHDNKKSFETVSSIIVDELQYNLNFAILNSKNFGIPQNRRRIFIVAWQPELGIKFQFPKPSNKKTCVGDILLPNHKVDKKYTISDLLWNSHQRRKRDHIKKGNGFGFSLVNRKSEYTRSISARYYKDGSEILIEQKGENPRKLTPREAANLQGFPSEPKLKIPVSDTQAYKQFGNSVTVPLVYIIGCEILKQLIYQSVPNQNLN